MRKYTTALVLGSALIAGVVITPALQAHDRRMPSGSMMGMMGDEDSRDGMMGMMNRMSRMMDHCNTMMQSRGSGRPNDQWRKNAPAAPDKNG